VCLVCFEKGAMWDALTGEGTGDDAGLPAVEDDDLQAGHGLAERKHRLDLGRHPASNVRLRGAAERVMVLTEPRRGDARHEVTLLVQHARILPGAQKAGRPRGTGESGEHGLGAANRAALKLVHGRIAIY